MLSLSPKTLALLGLLLTNLFWSGNAVIARYAATEIPPFTLAFGRWLLASCIILPFAWPHLRGKFGIIKARWRVILVLALLGVVIFNGMFYLAGHLTTAINITLINSGLPLTTLLVSWLLLKTAPGRWQVAGICISLLGVLMIIMQADIALLKQLAFNQGDLLTFIIIFIWSIYSVILGKYPLELHPIALIAVLAVTGLPFLAAATCLELILLPPVQLSTTNSAILLYVAIFPSILAYLFWGYGITVLGPNIAALSCYLMPLMTALIAVPFLGESLYHYHIVGGVMILLGLYLATLFKQSR